MRILSLAITLFAMNAADCIPETFAAPVVSPLAPTQDVLGESLQKTMIWAPSAAAPKTARLHLFADVRYRVWINGQYVLRGPARFEPTGPEYDSLLLVPTLLTPSALLAPGAMGYHSVSTSQFNEISANFFAMNVTKCIPGD